MKKLMFVAAVAAAMTGLADVEGANIVGYVNNTLKGENNTMAGASFVTVAGNGKKFSLADLKVGYTKDTTLLVKYEEPTWEDWGGGDGMWNGGLQGGELQATVLTDVGGTAACYTWVHKAVNQFTHDTEWIIGWAQVTAAGVGDVLTEEECKAITFDAGQGFWIYGIGAQFESSGAVGMADIKFRCNLINNTAVANGTGREWTLGDLTVGYTIEETDLAKYVEPTWEDWGGGDGMWNGGLQGGELQVTKLNSTGGTEECYTWVHKADDQFSYATTWQIGWAPVDKETGVGDLYTKEQLDAIAVPAGQGYWVYGIGATINFPKAIPTEEPAK